MHLILLAGRVWTNQRAKHMLRVAQLYPPHPKPSNIQQPFNCAGVFHQKTQMFPKQTPFILQQPRIDVILARSATPSQPRTKNLFVLLHFKEFLIQSIKAVLQISHGSTPSAAWSIFILLIRPLPSHFVIAKFILYRIFLWKTCHKNTLLHLLMLTGGRRAKTEKALVKIKFVSAVSRTV